nr:hypothetical protein HK105_004894 [Polyrhizophydium stewartii]
MLQTRETTKWIVSVLSASPASPNHLPFIDRVVFFLHETFANPVRTVSSPPFEISEEGWGGFVMNIELHFKGNAFPPHTLQHDFHLDMPQYSAIERLGSVCLDQPSVRDSLVQSLHALDKSSMIEVGRLVKLASLSNPSIYVRELRGETELFEFDLDTLDRPLLQAIYNIVHGLRHSSPLDAI